MFLSALVVAHNEESRLAACLSHLGFCDEIVVVLDRCTDASRDIAARFTPRLIEGAWEREGPRRHAGIDACQGPWILEVDADEHVTPAMAQEVRTLLKNPTAQRYLVPINNYIGSRLVKQGWGGILWDSQQMVSVSKGHQTLARSAGASSGDLSGAGGSAPIPRD